MPREQSEDTGRHFTHGSSASTADMAVDGKVRTEDRHIKAPHARGAEPLIDDEKHDQLAEKMECAEGRQEDRQEALLDEGLEETFPGSDPVSVKRIT